MLSLRLKRPEVEAFVDKFLLGKRDANTNVTVSPYDVVDHSRWRDLTIAYREDGAKLDKISISNDRYSPEGMGEPARNVGAAK